MAIETVPSSPPGQNQLSPAMRTSPFSMFWWTASTISNIPQESVGWLVAQGWQITDITYDQTTTPPTPYYAMGKQSLQNWLVLQSLINSYTFSLNEANYFNSVRYNQVIVSWTQLLNDAQSQFDAQVDSSNEHVALYLGNLGTYMTEIESALTTSESEIVEGADDISDKLTEYTAKLAAFETNYETHAAKIELLLTAQSNALVEYLADYAAALAQLDADYTTLAGTIAASLSASDVELASHIVSYNVQLDALETAYQTHASATDVLVESAGDDLTTFAGQATAILSLLTSDYNSISQDIDDLLSEADDLVGDQAGTYESTLALLLSDYETHAATAAGYLTDLGTTELARINEAFDASLAKDLVDLSNRGFYSSALVTDVTARNTRDRNEEIAKLNDTLNREKLANEHTLYGQQFAMRSATMDGSEKSYTLQQQVIAWKADWLNRLYGQLQEMRARTISIDQSVYGVRDALSRFSVEVESARHAKKQDVVVRTAEGLDRIHQLRDALERWETDNTYKLKEVLSALREATIESANKSLAANDAINQNAESQRDKLISQLQESLGLNLKGREQYVASVASNTAMLAEHRNKILVGRMNSYMTRLQALEKTQDAEQKLLAYQLDERNKLMIGLFGFVEKREDVAPDFSKLTELCTGLGDSDGGWVTP